MAQRSSTLPHQARVGPDVVGGHHNAQFNGCYPTNCHTVSWMLLPFTFSYLLQIIFIIIFLLFRHHSRPICLCMVFILQFHARSLSEPWSRYFGGGHIAIPDYYLFSGRPCCNNYCLSCTCSSSCFAVVSKPIIRSIQLHAELCYHSCPLKTIVVWLNTVETCDAL